MTHAELLKRAHKIVRAAGLENQVEDLNFLSYAELVIELISHGMSTSQRNRARWLPEFLYGWKKLYDEYEEKVRADPAGFYIPQHHVAEEFHSSPAFVRFFRAGNRTSKTQSGMQEDYWYATSQHPYRTIPYPSSIGIIAGLPFTTYAPKTFEKKFISGEGSENPLSPIFPEGGKWLYHYDPRRYIITLACPECAEKGKAGSCPHEKSQIFLFSSENGAGVIESFSARFIHFDENTPPEFYNAAQQRLKGQRSAGIIITTTPLAGLDAWEEVKVAKIAEGSPEFNKVNPEDQKSPPYASLHQISQWEAGIASEEEIRRDMQSMDDFEIRVRIFGEPAPLAQNPVFNREELTYQRKKLVTDPTYGALITDHHLRTAPDKDISLKFKKVKPPKPAEFQGLRVWEEPKDGEVYIAGVDTAAGLAGRDASCCHIFKVSLQNFKICLEQVAQVYGWWDTTKYATEVYKVCTWYNDALAVVELTGGLGRHVVQRLRQELLYWNIYRDTSGTRQEYADFREESRLGLETNVATKPAYISMTQSMLNDRRLILRDAETIKEFVAYEQERSPSGKTTLYRGAKGSRDDRVMSAAMACSVATVNMELFDFSKTEKPHTELDRDWEFFRRSASDYQDGGVL